MRNRRSGKQGVEVLIPVKRLTVAKSRLASALGGQGRRRLAAAMAQDVFEALRGSGVVGRIRFVGRGVALHRLARRISVDFACARGTGAAPSIGRNDDDCTLNFDVAAALRLMRRQGARRVVVAHADLPWLSPAAVRRFVRCCHGAGRGVVAAIEPLRGGTSLMALRPPNVIRPHFGGASGERHLKAARSSGVGARRVDIGAAVCDLDTADDLRRLLQPEQLAMAGRHTRRWAAMSRARTVIGVERVLASDASAFLSAAQALALRDVRDLSLLTEWARRKREGATGRLVTWSPKVFLPLTRLCRDVCHYCTFAQSPRYLAAPYLSIDEVLETAKRGVALGCSEALFTLGDRPEARWPQAAEALARLGFASTVDYLVHCAGRVLRETGMLPHINAGLLDEQELARLRPVSASMGLMLESMSERLCEPGMPHHGSPDKQPARRLATIEAAGRASVPFTSGILIGIGETRDERIESLLALRDSHLRHGHLQEVIVQDFHPKPGTRMASVPAPSLEELRWTIAVARLVLPADVAVQAPPNLNPRHLAALLDAGINDFGGVSPLTPDYVNPEAPWPNLAQLESACVASGLVLQPRLTIHPRYVLSAPAWADSTVIPKIRESSDAAGLFRAETWRTGALSRPPTTPRRDVSRLHALAGAGGSVEALLRRASEGGSLNEDELTSLMGARGDEVAVVCEAADAMTRRIHGDRVSYVVTRNINYTNRCTYGCTFCAFSKPARGAEPGTVVAGDAPYNLSLDEIGRRAEEAWQRGATEVCLQGGIHPRFDGETYLRIAAAVSEAAPKLHVHAFSPLEVWHGATTLGLGLHDYLERLRDAGLRSLPGTAAEILDDEVRAVLCPDKIDTAQWLSVMRAAHAVGLKSTATMMFGHVDAPRHWARHLLRIRSLQMETGGFTEFVPLPFVAAHTPLYRRGAARPGPTFREVLLVHAVARLSLNPALANIQASWVKLGPEGAAACLSAGANDLGGTLMNESITRAAGALHGQEMTPAELRQMARNAGRMAWQRTTLYGPADPERTTVAEGDGEIRKRSIELSILHV